MELNNPLLIIFLTLSGLTILRYSIYLLVSPLYTLQKANIARKYSKISKSRIKKNLKVSVIIPAWNEEVGITTSISSLLKNPYNNLEIVVVNDGSTDSTNKVVMDYYKKFIKGTDLRGKSFKYINKRKNGGKGSALNIGIKKATGDLIVTMDADTKFEKDAIETVVKYFQDESIDAGVGNIKIQNSKNIIGWIQKIEYILGFYYKRTHSIFNSEYIIGGAFGIYRKQLFKQYGYFDKNNKTEDLEFSMRMKSIGIKVVFIEDAIALTEGPSNFRGLIQQRLRWRKGALDVYKSYKHMFFSNDKKHNKFLCWFTLPGTIWNLIELFFFPIIITLIIFHLIQTTNLIHFLAWFSFSSITFFIIYFFGSTKNNLSSLLFIPTFFILIYVLTFVEIYALYKSLILLIKGTDITWQTWHRKGVENV